MIRRTWHSTLLLTLAAAFCCLGAAQTYPESFAGVYYREDFEEKQDSLALMPFVDKNTGGVSRRSTARIVTAADKVPLPKGGHALGISGENKWNGARITLPKGIPLNREVLLKCDFWTSGAANTIGLGVAAAGVPMTHHKVGPAAVKCHGKWSRAVWRLNDYFPEYMYKDPEKLIATAFRFVQRVSGGHEKPNGGGDWHQLVVDNVVIASGDGAGSIRRIMDELGGYRSYAGSQNYVIPGLKDVAVWHAPSTVKVFERRPLPKQRGSRVRISCARNEYESFQLVLRSPAPLRDMSVAVTHLTGPGGACIPSDRVRWHPVAYLPIRSRYFGIACDQRWPGPLSWNRSFSCQANVNQPVWFTVHVPKETPPGEYTGAINLTRAGMSLGRVPVTVNVWDFDFPDRVAFRTNVQVWTAFPNPWDSRRMREGRDESARLLAMYRMVDANNVIRYTRPLLKELVQDYQINTIKLPFCGGHGGGARRKVRKFSGHAPYSKEYETGFAEFIRRRSAPLKALGAWDRCFLYVWDEPWGDFDTVKMIQYIARLSKKQFPDLQTLVAAPYYKELEDCVDIFLAGYSASKKRREALAKGKQFWWWANSNTYLDMPGIDARMAWGLESVRKRISGAYAWGIFVLKQGSRKILNAPEDPKWPYTDPWRACARANYAAMVIWPGGRPESTPRRLVPSIILEQLRDGIEDYEYVAMLRNKARQLEAQGRPAEAKRAKALLARCDAFYRDPQGLRTDFSAVDGLAALRSEIAGMLAR